MKLQGISILIFLWCQFSLAQPVNLQTTTQINLSYSNVTLAGLDSPNPVSISLPSAPSISDGIGFQGNVFGTSAIQYLQYTMFGKSGVSRSINVSLQTALPSDYYQLVLQTGNGNSPNFGQSPALNNSIILSTLPKTWVMQLDYGASGNMTGDGIPFYYELQKNPSGNYGTLSAGNIQTNIIFTIVE